MHATDDRPESGMGKRGFTARIAGGALVFLAIVAAIVWGTGIFRNFDSAGQTVASKRATGPPPGDESLNRAVFASDWRTAERISRDLLAADPFDGRAIFNLAYSLHRQRRLDEAADLYVQAQDFHQYRHYSLYNLACIRAAQSRPDESLALLKTAIEDGFVSSIGVEKEFDFQGLVEDPEFRRLAELEKESRRKRTAEAR